MQLHPRAAEHYRDIVENLSRALEGDDAGEVRYTFRNLIGRINFKPLSGLGNFDLEVHGKLAAILSISEKVANCEVIVGAGIGFEPMTFRL